MLFVGLLPISDLLVQPLENQVSAARPELVVGSMAGIIFIGGAEDRRPGIAGSWAGSTARPSATPRSWLWRAATPASGSCSRAAPAPWCGGLPPEAETAMRVLGALGIEGDRLTLEAASRNTHENADLQRAPAEAAGRAAMAARHVGVAHAARGGLFPKAGLRCRGVAGGLPYAAALWDCAHSISRSRMDSGVFDGIVREYLGLLVYCHGAGRAVRRAWLCPGLDEKSRPRLSPS